MTHTNPMGFAELDSEIVMINRRQRGATKGFTSRNVDVEDGESPTMAEQ